MDHTIIQIRDQQSLIHLGSLDSFDITEGGKKAAGLILKYLETAENGYLREAVEIYERLIPNENFGGEYTALEWLCRYFLSDGAEKEKILSDPQANSFFKLLCSDGYKNLIYYLNNKYHIKDDRERELSEVKTTMRFLEDFILFINPDRERWETTRENLLRCDLTCGMRIADVGCGPGYYTYKFSDIVGKEGRVYAIETNPRHLEFLSRHIRENDLKNIEVVESSFEGIGLSADIRVDVVFVCSLYHNIYAAFTQAERDQFVGSIRRALNDNGRLIIVDNDLVEQDRELPYHGPYISKELIISQLWYYGFELKDTFQFSPQRYVLIFDKAEMPVSVPDFGEIPSYSVAVRSSSSLVNFRIIGTSTSGYTRRGKIWGRVMYEGLMENDPEKLCRALTGFSALWKKERIGDDYTALMWFIEYRLKDEKERDHMTTDIRVRYYADYFCGNDFDRLKTYLRYKFHLDKPDDPEALESTCFEYDGEEFSIDTLNQWNEHMVFGNPNRSLWEKTDEMCSRFPIKKGENVADLGCGCGAFSWTFSKLVGKEGKVYATEINKEALYYLEDFIEKYKVENIEPHVTRMNDVGLPENSVDVIFMCSMYHAVYITDIEFVKDDFIQSIHRALRKGGRLIIVDNQINIEGVVPYYGAAICPELTIAQLHYYGFSLKERFELIPQRYVLIFEEAKKDDGTEASE